MKRRIDRYSGPPYRLWMAGLRRWRSRRVVFDSFDEAMFMLAMWETFPRMWVLDDRYGFLEPSDLVGPSGLADLISQNSAIWHLHFPEEGWRPIILPEPQGRYNFIANAPRHFVHYVRGRWSWSTMGGKTVYSAPTRNSGELSIQIDPDDEADCTFVRTVWGVVRRVATNRAKLELPHSGIVYSADSRGSTWCGHHVFDWCQQVYDRMAAGQFRPVDGWKAPDTPWHRDMRERVIAQFGHELDEPKEPETVHHDGPSATFVGLPVGKPK